ncbi:hypothetical protein DFS34DRAFT_4460 [Phlyctochytrium arcticum]|nr:hypothetical protein DFS34DRAFT_4460 [Phlyctochytrium arcticum]
MNMPRPRELFRHPSSIISTITYIPFLLLALTTAVSSQTTSRCLTLTKTSACPAQEGRPIVISSSFYNDTATFDTFITGNYDTNPSYITSFQTAYGCSRFQGQGQRYHISFYCSYIVEASALWCGTSAGTAKTICRDTCNKATASLASMFSNSQICDNAGDTERTARTDMLTNYNGFCSGLKNDPSSCDEGTLPFEVNTCGFFSKAEAETFCNNSANQSDPCCSKVLGTSKALTPASGNILTDNLGAFIGIVAAVLVLFVAVAVFAARRVRGARVTSSVTRKPPLTRLQTSEFRSTQESGPYSPRLPSPVSSHGPDSHLVRKNSLVSQASSSPHADVSNSFKQGFERGFAQGANQSFSLSNPNQSFNQSFNSGSPTNSHLAAQGYTRQPSAYSPTYSPYFDNPSSPPFSGPSLTSIPSPPIAAITPSSSSPTRSSPTRSTARQSIVRPPPQLPLPSIPALRMSTLTSATGPSTASIEGSLLRDGSIKEGQGDNLPNARMKVWAEYAPELEDELPLKVGDIVEIRETFSDGKYLALGSERCIRATSANISPLQAGPAV